MDMEACFNFLKAEIFLIDEWFITFIREHTFYELLTYSYHGGPFKSNLEKSYAFVNFKISLVYEIKLVSHLYG